MRKLVVFLLVACGATTACIGPKQDDPSSPAKDATVEDTGFEPGPDVGSADTETTDNTDAPAGDATKIGDGGDAADAAGDAASDGDASGDVSDAPSDAVGDASDAAEGG